MAEFNEQDKRLTASLLCVVAELISHSLYLFFLQCQWNLDGKSSGAYNWPSKAYCGLVKWIGNRFQSGNFRKEILPSNERVDHHEAYFSLSDLQLSPVPGKNRLSAFSRNQPRKKGEWYKYHLFTYSFCLILPFPLLQYRTHFPHRFWLQRNFQDWSKSFLSIQKALVDDFPPGWYSTLYCNSQMQQWNGLTRNKT